MSKERMRCCTHCCRIINTDLMNYEGQWCCDVLRLDNSNMQNAVECHWISAFGEEVIPDFSNEQIAKDFYVRGIIPSYIIQRWIVMALKYNRYVLIHDGFTIGKLEKLISLGKDSLINELNTMVSLGEIDKKGFKYSMGKTHAEINERVSKLEQKYLRGLVN